MSNLMDLGVVFVADVVRVGGMVMRVVEVSCVQWLDGCPVSLVGISEGSTVSYQGMSSDQVEMVERGEWGQLFDGCEEEDAEVDEENDSPFSEYEQGWINIRNENRAIVERQNREDAEYAKRPQAPSYMGIRGSFEPDGGVIYEP